MPAPPKPTDGNLRTFGSPPSRGDVNDKSLPLNLNTGSLIGIGTMGAGLAGAAGLGIRRRNDALAAKGAISINNAMADPWLSRRGNPLGNRPEIQWVVQDLFHPDPNRRAEAVKHIETIPATSQEKIILSQAAEAGETWNNPPKNPVTIGFCVQCKQSVLNREVLRACAPAPSGSPHDRLSGSLLVIRT